MTISHYICERFIGNLLEFFSCWIVYEKVLPSLFWTFQISNLSWNLPYSYFAFDTAFLSDFSSFRCLLFSFSRIVFSIPLLFERERFRSRLKTKFILDSVSESPPWIGLGWLSRLKILFTYDSFKNCRPCCPNPPVPDPFFPEREANASVSHLYIPTVNLIQPKAVIN